MELILHHYDFSSFSEKVRLVLGYKALAWHAVEIPACAPKPDYTPLTAGYRRTPALQVGADVYCDTRLIVEVLERLQPIPTLYPGAQPAHTRARCEALIAWAEHQLFWPVALYVTGVNAAHFPPEFHTDRAHLHGKPQPTLAQVAASARKYLAQAEIQLRWIEDLLGAGHPFVLGDDISVADFAIYESPWFLELIGGPSAQLERQPLTRAWMERVAAVGHGRPQSLTAEQALARARAATPLRPPRSDYVAPEDIALGEPVTVSPFDQHAPATGTLAYIDAERITLMTHDEALGDIAVHFPRLGYRIKRARV